jgi:hypothetical protein
MLRAQRRFWAGGDEGACDASERLRYQRATDTRDLKSLDRICR